MFGGAFQGTLFSIEKISGKSGGKSKNCRLCSTNFVTFVKTAFFVFCGTFVRKNKNFRWNDPHLLIVRGFWAKKERNLKKRKSARLSKLPFKCPYAQFHSDFFGLFFILKVFRLWAKVSPIFVRKISATCQISNLCVLRKTLKNLNF